MRIVADTNTVISGLLYGGFPQEIINAIRAKRITLYSSVSLIAEFAEVIAREKFATQIRAALVSLPELVADYAQLARIVAALRAFARRSASPFGIRAKKSSPVPGTLGAW